MTLTEKEKKTYFSWDTAGEAVGPHTATFQRLRLLLACCITLAILLESKKGWHLFSNKL